MDWTRAIDGYCERTDPSYWAEPVNAVSNLAFLIAAIVMWERTKGQQPGRVLSGMLFVIGLGSYLLHTHAVVWTAILDVLPILVFALTYIYLANRNFLDWHPVKSAVGAVVFLPYAAGVQAALSGVPFLSISAEYWALPLMIGGYGAWLLMRRRAVGRGLLIGAGLLVVSLIFRSLDEGLCEAFPLGTHFLWHLINAVMLGWMIEVWARDARARLHIAGRAG